LPESRYQEIAGLAENFSEMLKSLQVSFVDQTKLMEDEKKHIREKELIIKDLHDGIGGIVTNIAMLGEYGVSSSKEPVILDILKRIVGLAREGNLEVRSFMNSAFSGDSGWADLMAEIKDYCATMLEPHGIKTVFVSEVFAGAAVPGVFIYCNIMRIAREAVTNALKHAGAVQVQITFRVTEESFELIVSDNGVGFDSDRVRKRGIANMYSRAQDMAAVFSIAGVAGTVVSLKLLLHK
jgi:signal transduction histidine kinase